MKNSKIVTRLAISLVLIGGLVLYYVFLMPHRNVQSSKSDYNLNASELVNEYLSNPELANEKYLDSEGESKIIEVTGNVYEVSEDLNNNKVIILKSEDDKAGVSCTFTPETNAKASQLKTGDKITVKGVIRAGASFDSDLDMYENVILEKCDLVSTI